MSVCAVDGVDLGESRAGGLVHLGALPADTPEHEPQPVELSELLAFQAARGDLVQAAEEMLVHHATLHPHTGCEWAERLQAALGSG